VNPKDKGNSIALWQRVKIFALQQRAVAWATRTYTLEIAPGFEQSAIGLCSFVQSVR
jgi:hypothetical protein